MASHAAGSVARTVAEVKNVAAVEDRNLERDTERQEVREAESRLSAEIYVNTAFTCCVQEAHTQPIILCIGKYCIYVLRAGGSHATYHIMHRKPSLRSRQACCC